MTTWTYHIVYGDGMRSLFEAGPFPTATEAVTFAARTVGRTAAEVAVLDDFPAGVMMDDLDNYGADARTVGFTVERYDGDSTDGSWGIDGGLRMVNYAVHRLPGQQASRTTHEGTFRELHKQAEALRALPGWSVSEPMPRTDPEPDWWLAFKPAPDALDTCDRCGKPDERITVSHGVTDEYEGLCDGCLDTFEQWGKVAS